MNEQFGRFKVWDTLEKKILEGHYSLSDSDHLSWVKQICKDNEGMYLHAIGRRDRYIVIPQLPRKDKEGVQIWVGDILSNGSEHLWVIRFDLMRGVYASLISMPDSVNQVDFLLESGLVKVGDLFNGLVVKEVMNHSAKVKFDVERFL